MRKPLIGITCNLDYRDDIGVVTHLGCKGEEWQSLSDGYISRKIWRQGESLLRAGCGEAGQSGYFSCEVSVGKDAKTNFGYMPWNPGT